MADCGSTMQDSTLWLHMILMGLTFGLVFPFGMVLGVCSGRGCGGRFQNHQLMFLDCALSMARSCSGRWNRRRRGGLLYGPRS